MGDDRQKNQPDEQTPSGYPQHSPGVRVQGLPILHETFSHLPLMPKKCTTGLPPRARKICLRADNAIPIIVAVADGF